MSDHEQLHERLGRVADRFADSGSKPAVQRQYLRFFTPDRPILDVGCGKGEFLDLLRELGIEGVGIDACKTAIQHCTARGHDVITGDAVDAIEMLAQDGRQFGGAMLSHVIEHLPPSRALELLDALRAVVASGGNLVIATPNTKNLVSITEFFWLDPTHVRPYPRALIEALGADSGWRVTESFDDPATVPVRGWLKRTVAGIRSALSGADRSGPLDAVVVLTRA